MIRKLLSVSILLVFLSQSVLAQSNSIVKSISDSQWYGTIKFGNNELYLTKVEFSKAKNKAGSGAIFFPEFLNSAIDFDYQIDGNNVLIENQQYHKGLHVYRQFTDKFTLSDGNLTTSFHAANGPIAKIKLSAANSKEVEDYKELAEDNRDKHGELIYLEEIEKTEADKLYAHFFEGQDQDYSVDKGIGFSGDVNMMGLQGKAYMALLGTSYYIEMSIADAFKTVSVATDTLSWDYQSSTGVTSVYKGRMEGSQFMASSISEDSDIDVLSTWRTTFNGNESIAFHLTVNGEYSTEVFNADSGFLSRSITGLEYIDYDEYEKIYGFDYPTVWRFGSSDGLGVLSLEPTEDVIYKEMFSIPEEYSNKIVYLDDETEELNAEQWNNKGVDEVDNGLYEEAEISYNKAIELYDQNGLYYYNRGFVRELTGSYYDAISDYKQSLKLGFEPDENHNRIGVCMYDIGDYDNALLEFESAIEANPNLSDAHSNLYFLNRELGNIEESLSHANELVRIGEDNTAHYLKAISLVSLERWDAAIVEVEKSIDNGFKDAEVHNYHGIALFGKGEYELAAEKYNYAIQLEDTIGVFHLNLADAYYFADNYEAASKHYYDALEFDDLLEDGDFFQNFAYTLFELEDMEASLQMIDKAIALYDGNANYHDAKGNILHGFGKNHDAIESYTRSIGIYPDDPWPYFWRGLANEAMGNNGDACSDFKKASEMELAEAVEKTSEFCKGL